ncbi:MAG: hypothetical protein A2901_07735 [Elusimicrobia bacterium RIFCSPLOWO2_01_FULL_54_10]|nr:MAG: hypothetical protein A2901_07735 [Elusimicrobia bacterium RIFCSPLOWO2_01_FULL_54_10]
MFFWVACLRNDDEHECGNEREQHLIFTCTIENQILYYNTGFYSYHVQEHINRKNPYFVIKRNNTIHPFFNTLKMKTAYQLMTPLPEQIIFRKERIVRSKNSATKHVAV